MARLVDQARSFFFGFPQLIGRAVLSQLEIGLCAFRCRQPFANGDLTVAHRLDYRRPNKLPAEPDKHEERDALANERQVESHKLTSILVAPFGLRLAGLKP